MMGNIILDMVKNDIPMINGTALSIEKFQVKEISKSKFKKASLDISFNNGKRFRRSPMRKVSCTIKVMFMGRGDICYRIDAKCSMRVMCADSQVNCVKTYTYEYLKDMLEKDTQLLELYPRDLVYPSAPQVNLNDLQSQYKSISVEKEEERRFPIHKASDVPDNRDGHGMYIEVTRDTPSKKSSFTDVDNEEYNKIIHEYNSMQKKA